jgi:TonB family protein
VKPIHSHIIAGVTTLVLLLLLLLLLIKLHMNAPVLPEDEGIVVSIGVEEVGGGMPDMLTMNQETKIEQAPAPSQPTQPSNNDLIVQEDEESLQMPQQSQEDAKQMAEEALRKQREEERLEAERIARDKALAEQRAKEQQAIDKANQLAALFGQAGSAEGANAENATANPSNSSKGNPVGKSFGQVDGNMWSLEGRSMKIMPKPSMEFNEQGKVVVTIRVDKKGNVILVSIGDGTNISNRQIQQLALDAARKAKFSEGDKEQIGSITYNFKLN